MKSLVVTTGKERPIMDVWLPSLRDKGEYTGVVLIVDYYSFDQVKGFNNDAVRYLQTQNNIFYRKVHHVYPCIASDRVRTFLECIKGISKNYDVILITEGNDIEFLKPIQPLLDMALKELCYANYPIKWDQREVAVPLPTAFYDKFVINAGMFAAPSKICLIY